MKLYKCKEKKTGCYLCFNDEVLVASSKNLFLYLMREANNNIRISGGVPFFVCDYEFEEMEVSDNICPAYDDDHSYEMQSDMRDYCERYEPTYNPEDGSM